MTKKLGAVLCLCSLLIASDARADIETLRSLVEDLYTTGKITKMEYDRASYKGKLKSLRDLAPDVQKKISLYDSSMKMKKGNWPFELSPGKRFYGDFRWMGKDDYPYFRVFYSNGEKHHAAKFFSVIIVHINLWGDGFFSFCTSFCMRNALFQKGSFEQAVDYGFNDVAQFEEYRPYFENIDELFIFSWSGEGGELYYDLVCKEATEVSWTSWRHDG